MNKQQEQELDNFLSAMYSAGLLEKRIGADGKEEFRKTEKLQGLEAQEVLDICEADIAKRCEEDINHPDYKDKTNYHEYTREECEYHNIDYDELHANDDCDCESDDEYSVRESGCDNVACGE